MQISASRSAVSSSPQPLTSGKPKGVKCTLLYTQSFRTIAEGRREWSFCVKP